MVRVAALFCDVFRARFDCADVTGVRVLPSHAGRVTVTFTECPSSDAATRRLDGVAVVRRLEGRVAPAESAETRRVPNLAFAEDSLE